MNTLKMLIALLAGALFTTSLSSCAPGPDSEPIDPKDQPIQPLDHLLDMPSWATPYEELDSHENDVFYHQTNVSNVETDYTFSLKMDRDTYEGNLRDYVRVYDSVRYEYSLKFETSDSIQYKVSPNTPYEAGRFYTVELKENAPYHFAGKDPNIKEFHFSTKALGDSDTYNVKDTVHRFLLSEIISKQETETSTEDTVRIITVKNPLKLKQGDHFLFWNGETIDRKAFYGKFHHETSKFGFNTVYYTNPDLGEIFGEDGLDVSYHNYVPTEIYDLVLSSENEIKENMMNDPALEDFLYKSYLLYEPHKVHVSNDAYDWIQAMKNITIAPEFGFYWPGWSFSISLKLTIPLDYVSITFFWQYYRQSTIKADAEIQLRDCMGVPYWADLAVDISEVVDVTYRFCIIVGDTLPAPEEDDDDQFYNDLDEYAAKKAGDFNDADDKFETIKKAGKDGVQFDGKTLTIKLGTGRFPIGWLFDIFIDFNFTLRLEATVMLSFSYTEHSENNIISYRSGDEDKSSHSVSSLESCSKTITLIGQLGIDVGLFLKFGIGVCGLEDYISFSIHANIGIYVSIGGYGMWTWKTTPSGKYFEGHGGFIFEVGWFASVGVELALFLIDLSVDFITIRSPFYTTTAGQYFVSPPVIEGNKISLETHKVLVKDLNMLTFDTFNVAYMKTEISDFDPEVELDYNDDHGDEQHGKVFNFSFKSGKYIRYEEGYLIIDDDCPCKFTDTMYVDVPRSLYKLPDGVNHFIEVDIDFYDYQARPVYFDGELLDYYRFGDVITIPGSPGEKEGYRFYGWYCKENNSYYGKGEQFIVPKKNEKHAKLELTSDYYEIIYHTVRFYDGLGNLICTQKVEEGTDAEEPSVEERDRQMPENAVFVGWSTDFTNVFYDTDVYAIYFYIDAEGN